MNFLNRIALKTGVSERNNFDLSSDHVTTSDFFRVLPVHSIPTVPSGKYNIKAQTFTRLSPMTNPVLGRCTIHNRAFFVPFPIIMHCWNAFITDSPYSDQTYSNIIPSKVTTFSGSDVARFFLQSTLSTTTTNTVSDFIDYSTGSTVNRNFTAYGRRCWQILSSLGYKIPLGAATKALLATPDNTWNVEYSALKLLAFYKVYKDWYANQAYNQAAWDSVFYRVNGSLDYNDLNNIFGMISLAMYDKDYFTAASDNPVTPNSSVSSSYTIFDQTNDRTGSNSNATGLGSRSSSNATSPSSPSLKGMTSNGSDINSQGSPMNITQFMIDQLKALTDYLKRNNLVGAKYADRMLARFGVKPSDAELHMSIPIGSTDTLVQISDVMCQGNGSALNFDDSGSATRYSLLGDYAGKGVGLGRGGFYYEANDYGLIIVVSSIIPKIGYVNGSDRFNTMYMNRLDFFTPEFDGKSGVQAIRVDELKSDFRGAPPTGYGPSDPISFIPRWADLKLGKDNLTGDFILGSRNAGLEGWYMFRMFPDSSTLSQLKHSEAFTRGEQSQYDRIFAYTGTTYDHFILIYNFDVKASLPMTKLFDNYEFDGGREITMEVNGKQFN